MADVIVLASIHYCFGQRLWLSVLDIFDEVVVGSNLLQ
jgi:hypothetical protein